MDGEEILIENKKVALELKMQEAFPIIDLGHNLVIAQWIETFLKELDQDLKKGGNK